MTVDAMDNPCRRMPTRGCPPSYGGVCGDEAPWQAEEGGDSDG